MIFLEVKRVSVGIPIEFYEVVEAEAKREGLSISSYLCKMIMTNAIIESEVESKRRKAKRAAELSNSL